MSLFSKSVKIKDSNGKALCSVGKTTKELRVPYVGGTVDFTPLNGHPNLEHLELVPSNETGMNSGDAKLPKKLPKLRVLEIRGQVTNPSVLTNFTTLQHLNAGRFYFPKNLDFLRAFPHLESLEIVANLFEDLNGLKHVPGLKSLILYDGFKFDLEPLTACKGLKKLHIDYHAKGAKYLKQLHEIEDLTLADFKTKNISYIKHMTKLRRLSLFRSKMTSFDGLQNFTQLEHLVLRQTKIDNEGLKLLSGLQKLQSLSLMYVNTVTDLGPVSQLKSLKELDLFEMKGPLASIEPLLALEKLEDLTLSFTPFKKDPIDALCKMRWLKELAVSVSTQEQKDRLVKSLSKTNVHTIDLPDPSTYKDIGEIRVWLPGDDNEHFFISQDLTELLGVEAQDDAEEKVRDKISTDSPDILSALEFDSEGSAFVAYSESEAAITKLAKLINSISDQ